MVRLAMIVLDEFRDDLSEVPLTDWNDAIETFFLDRPYESLGVRVRVWRALGDQHHADVRLPEPTPDILAPTSDPDRRSRPDVGSRHPLRHRQRPHDLLHEQRLRMRRGSSDLHAAGPEIDDEDGVIRDGTLPGP